MIKREVRRLSSQHRDGSLMFPRPMILTWVLIGSVWHLVGMEKQ